MTVALRPYQERAIERLRDHARAGARRLLLVAPTGAGKTTIAGHLILSAVERGKRVLFVAHRRELIVQAYRRLLEMGLPENAVGIIMATDVRRRPSAAVQVASIDTIRHRPKPPADLVIVDEAHRALARSYVELAAFYAHAVHLGLTATPFRADGQGLSEMYDQMAVVASPRELIDDGFLVEPRVFTVPAAQLPELDRVRVRGGDYDEAALARAVDRPTLVGNILEHWLKHAAGVRTVAFAVSVAHSRHLAERFRDAGVMAEHLDGSTPAAERDAILRRLDQRQTLVVSNVGCLCEGWDQPPVKCAILARPTRSTTLYLQQAGRILRPWQDQRAIILDHGGCAVEHGLPQDDREYSLAGCEKQKRGTVRAPQPLVVCDACQAVMPAASRSCPECGHTFETVVPDEDAGQLVEITSGRRARAAARDPKRAYYQQLLATESSVGWARARYRFELGERPPRGKT